MFKPFFCPLPSFVLWPMIFIFNFSMDQFWISPCSLLIIGPRQKNKGLGYFFPLLLPLNFRQLWIYYFPDNRFRSVSTSWGTSLAISPISSWTKTELVGVREELQSIDKISCDRDPILVRTRCYSRFFRRFSDVFISFIKNTKSFFTIAHF